MIDIRHWIYEILPTSTYRTLSNKYHLLLQYVHTIRSHEHYDGDNMYLSVVIGLSFGVVLVTFLEFFPGEPFSMELEKDREKKKTTSTDESTSTNNSNTAVNSKDGGDSNSSNSTNDNDHGRSDDGDMKTILQEKMIGKAQAKYGLSSEEIEEILLKTKDKKKNTVHDNPNVNVNESTNTAFNDIEDDLELTLTQKLNLLVYGSLMVGFIYVLNRDYDSVVTLGFMKTFPREARTLGFQMPMKPQS
mmetsp:Transcript_2213/g.3155  ORF Transcript_2213/g.3155 Transcript_2213/m.3155 type:complete len:246 (-) Transcript_2213:40-777(-)|eukprot:CAMPEP_0203674034 /NCGR_PEP_ID=MMETSP0090-20130426/14614_1 /ASSEMBLY_ACC=CAM_ASM_001088 /TAXON_ID=426623 /ORGANISM="Chaetoceros affinis, Strain CCMP159" /LENGTH=245 /DNA_ID=CAMNT_0050539803 /DNA_START=145 /DNA_END=882 /DNA_ORIENTATION=+